MTTVSKKITLRGEGSGPTVDDLHAWVRQFPQDAADSPVVIELLPGRSFEAGEWAMSVTYDEEVEIRQEGWRKALGLEQKPDQPWGPTELCDYIMRHGPHNFEIQSPGPYGHRMHRWCPGNDDGSAD